MNTSLTCIICGKQRLIFYIGKKRYASCSRCYQDKKVELPADQKVVMLSDLPMGIKLYAYFNDKSAYAILVEKREECPPTYEGWHWKFKKETGACFYSNNATLTPYKDGYIEIPNFTQ